ncbi:myb/SANT-like DNA-binding domain-containing protein 4 [Conger conger]|uniref:myb/SANT-like DNA-binding domain-containing protein 4 n=1 Tax=Conger conger TaxID=82655 RepID=UPI002A59CF0F|nr:myb/SANT-like DNA-binding domain-containing protein 4 [Conger conger]
MKHLKRKRKSNYSAKETQALIREIHKRRHILFSKQQNTAIKELKRRAWEEVANCVNALGEGDLRTAVEVKRRYLDWRVLMKRKQVRAELSSLKDENDPSLSEDNVLCRADLPPDLGGFPKDQDCDWQNFSDMERANSPPAVQGDGGEEEDDEEEEEEEREEENEEDHFPLTLPDVDREGCMPDTFSRVDEFGLRTGAKAERDLEAQLTPDGVGVAGLVLGMGGVGSLDLLVAVARQRLELERRRLQVETERLRVEKRRLLVEREKLRQAEVERERLQVERDRLRVEKERLVCQAGRGAPVPAEDCERERKAWQVAAPPAQTQPAASLASERLQLETERMQLEKETLTFFKLESGRLQIEKERFRVEKERMRLQKDGQQLALQGQ